MYDRVSFSCPSCQTKLRASTCFGGRSCHCPRCGLEVVVPFRVLDEESPALVMDEGHGRARWRDGRDFRAEVDSH